MSRELRLALEDMIEFARLCAEWTRGMDYERFAEHPPEYHAAIRALIVIGEAARHLPYDFRENNPDIAWREIIGMRDIIVHRYFGVSDDYIWDAVTTELPSLVARLGELLGEIVD